MAGRWDSRLAGRQRVGSGKLQAYLERFGYEVPVEAAAGNVGATLRRMRPTLDGARPLTVGQQEAWRRLLAHNRHDCAGMRVVCMRVAHELDSADRRRSRSRRTRRSTQALVIVDRATDP